MAQPTCVLGVIAQRCQGLTWGWSLLPWSTLPEAFALPACLPEPARDTVSLTSDAPLYHTLEPPVPPPRIGRTRFFAA